MWTAPGLPLVNGHCRRPEPCLFLIVGLIKSARLDIKGGSGAKWFVRVQSFGQRTYASTSRHVWRGRERGLTDGELRRAVGVITSYATQFGLSPASILMRKDLVV